ncbi:MAG: MraY family glycosyltransferase [Gemmatimonadales bacterium]
MSRPWILLLGAVIASWALTGAIRRWALRTGALDVPGPRSLHVVPVPRSGGAAIATVTLAAVAGLGAFGLISASLAQAIFPGGLLIATVGWLDDRQQLAPGLRLVVHFAAAGWAVWSLGGLSGLELGLTRIHLGTVGAVLAVLAIVWAINLYNFMDGIDGLAGAEAVQVGIAGALLAASNPSGLSWVAAVMAAASAGFLWWNRPPARIFMGDVGSGLLGFTMGVLAIASETTGGPPSAVWLLLLGVFVFDATVTLARRLLAGEPVYRPHRSHAYQRMILAGATHGRVTAIVVGINVALALLAFAAVQYPRGLPAAIGMAGLGLASGYVAIERRQPMTSSTPGL